MSTKNACVNEMDVGNSGIHFARCLAARILSSRRPQSER